MIRTYDQAFVERMRDFAVLGLYPEQIAERMGLMGKERQDFLEDIANEMSSLHTDYVMARRHHEEDVDAALASAAASGDTDAMELSYRIRRERKYDQIVKDLFGI